MKLGGSNEIHSSDSFAISCPRARTDFAVCLPCVPLLLSNCGILDNFSQIVIPRAKYLGVPVDSSRLVYISFAYQPRLRPMNMDTVYFSFRFPAPSLTGSNATSIDLSAITQPLSNESKAFREQWLTEAFKYAPDGFAAQSQLVGVNCTNLEAREIAYVFFDPKTKNIFFLTVQSDYFDLVKETTDWQTCLKNQKLLGAATAPVALARD